jgi:phage terminase small subunit
MRNKITAHQRLFVHEYLIDFCGTRAAIRAGHPRNSAKVYASHALALPHIKKLVERLKAKKLGKLIMTREEILRELTIIGGLRPSQVYTQAEGGELLVKSFEDMGSAQGAIAEIKEDRIIKEVVGDNKKPDTTMVLSDKRTLRFHDKIRALELLGKHEGLFPMKVEGELTVLAKLSIEAMKKSAKEAEDADASE